MVKKHQKIINSSLKQLIYCLLLIAALIFLSNGSTLSAQKIDSTSTKHSKLWEIPQKTSKNRLIAVSGLSALAYGTTMYSLNKYWYASFDKSKFHFYNDSGEWNQMDKVGHLWTAYAESYYMYGLYKWTGIDNKKAIWIGGMLGWTYQASIEVLDGYSERWGASLSDVAANTLGSALFISQQLIWNEQKFKIKFSSSTKDYKSFDPIIQTRVDDLFGTSLSEKILKDYNAQTYWLSFNPFHLKNNSSSKFPKWLDVSLGYGVENIFGGFENEWVLNGQTFDYTHIKRSRQYFLSLDIDWTKIKSKSKAVNILLRGLNIFKVPAPTLETNFKGKPKFHWIFF